MTEINRARLFGKLNETGFKSLEGATKLCKLRGNPYVELVHWLNQILSQQDSDLHHILRHFELDLSAISRDTSNGLESLRAGATAISDLSHDVCEAAERGWVYTSLLFSDDCCRTGYLLVGILKTPSLRSKLIGISPAFDRISVDALVTDFSKIVSASSENNMRSQDGSGLPQAEPGEASGAMAAAQMGGGEALARYTTDMTADAREGEMDPIVGRDTEIRQMVDILMRRRQNNPILTGEAGVGKTAVVEGFAQRIVRGDVPPALRNVSLLCLDIGLLQAGASMKGEFENRLRQVIEEVQSSEKPIILFVDEAHTLIGAGGAAGTGDAANLLKPALARGLLRTVAATTWSEYKKHIEKDPALTRRFQVVKIEEPDEKRAVLMMRGLAASLENHHGVQVLDSALEAAVSLSHRYIPARQLPDKSVSLLDTAAARVAISQHAVPAELDDCQRRISALKIEQAMAEKEQRVGIERGGRLQDIERELDAADEVLQSLERRWQEERDLVSNIIALRESLNTAEKDDSATEQGSACERSEPPELIDQQLVKAELQALQKKLSEVQGESPLVLSQVDAENVATVVQDWTGVPVGRMVRNEVDTVLNLPDLLEQRIVGQRHALEAIARRVQTSRAAMDNPNKPVGVFLLAGSSGVGKTETALALAETLYGGEQNLITINMSEFQEAHTVSTLKGAPPGYVGYGEGGVLTEAVRRRPHSVVLLDEVEKAHSDVHEIFFQVFDKGVMEDGEGRQIDFRNTLILLTSNCGTDLIVSLCKDPDLMPDVQGLATALREPLLKVFPAALLGRLVTIPYFPLSDQMIRTITKLQLAKVAQRLADNHGISLDVDDSVLELIVERCNELDSGGRMIDSILTNTLLPEISCRLLEQQFTDAVPIVSIQVSVAQGVFSYGFSEETDATTIEH